jgi:hypothetical protein
MQAAVRVELPMDRQWKRSAARASHPASQAVASTRIFPFEHGPIGSAQENTSALHAAIRLRAKGRIVFLPAQPHRDRVPACR